MDALTNEELDTASGLKWSVPTPFVAKVQVQTVHMDEYRHTNNVVYLSWIQDIARLHSATQGLTFEDYVQLGVGCVARKHDIHYVQPSYAGDTLYVATWVQRNEGRSDMWRATEFIRKQDGALIAKGLTQWVCVDMATGRPKRQPPVFLSAYSTHPALSNT
ncbi:acyl-CoA thioesterase [Limnobacter humi]|uniref:Acyl-CoA thioesterase n=1 Tax=Limnobacter humi TaxID=1778671 RepID=A0ABT1WG27_9BURK|nr:acyl-CoA thioesterase [Limnobacter humi]MCQ8896473.1 acyl-CoA thioesterase [Limnobacter humi]